MADSVHVETAREPDRDALLEALVEQGVEATPVGDAELSIPCDDEDPERACAELLASVEHVIAETGLPLVAQEIDGAVHVRPPGE